MTSYKDIDPADLLSLMSIHKVLLVDVRNADEVAKSGIIAGAEHIPLHLIPVKLGELSNEQPLVFYCHSGMRSAQACAFMSNKGRNNIFNLQGGILAWGKAGFSFEQKL